jgi:LysM repeat protein
MKITDIVNITSLNEAGSWQDLYAANQSTISDPNKIQIGQKINLPGGGTYTVQKGDTLSKIARQQSGGAAQSGRGAKPSPTAAVAAAAKDAENLTPYSMTADVAGVTGLAAAAGQFLPKVGGTIAKVVPGLNTVYQGADALRRASLGDYTGSAISAAGAVPVLGLPAVAAQAVRDKYRTGSFFPSDQELKTAVDKNKGTKSTTDASNLKEDSKIMNKKQLKKRLEKLEETKFHMIQRMHDRAIAEGKADAAIRFGKMLRGLGGGMDALPASTVRKGGQTFDKVRGVDSELKYVNRANPKDIKSLDDIKNIGDRKPAVWRKGGPGAASAAERTAVGSTRASRLAGAAEKTGKPLGRGTTAAIAATGGGMIGAALGMDDDGQGPKPTPLVIAPNPAPSRDNLPSPSSTEGPQARAPTMSDRAATGDDQRLLGINKSNQNKTTSTPVPDVAAKPNNDSGGAAKPSTALYAVDTKATADRDRVAAKFNNDSGGAAKPGTAPYAVDQEATDARNRVAAKLKEELQHILRLAGRK